MVYLVRTSSILKDWEKAWKIASVMSEHIKKEYKEVKDSYFLTNIAGPVDQVHWVIEFTSLADEERFALRAMEDKVYFQGMVEMEGLTTPLVDRLYRREPSSTILRDRSQLAAQALDLLDPPARVGLTKAEVVVLAGGWAR